MKQLTKEETGLVQGYCNNDEKTEILHNGQNGYCAETKTIVSCCPNCGHYSRAKIDDEGVSI